MPDNDDTRTRIDADVLVVGAGPTGLTAAVLLAQHGLRAVVIDRYPEPYPLPRAVHLDDEVLRILHGIGVADEFRAVSRPGRGLRVVTRALDELARFDRGAEETGFPAANMFDQPDLERILQARADRCEAITVLRGVELTAVRQWAQSVQADARHITGDATLTLSGRYLLGCDGAGSSVRAAIGARLRSRRFDQRWLVLDVDADAGIRSWGGVDQVFDAARPGTYMHVVGCRHRWEFRLHEQESAADFRDPARVRELVAPWLADPSASLELVRTAEYVFRAALADRWRDRRVFLLGDAAHLTPPFIGQGLGAGLRDAANLAWKLAEAFPAGDRALLGSYETERKPHVAEMTRRAVLIGTAMTSTSPVARVLRGVILPRLDRVPAVRRMATESATPPLTLRPRGSGPLRGTLWPFPLGPVGSRGVLVSVRDDPGLRALCAGAGLEHRLLDATAWFGPSAYVLLRPDGTVFASTRDARAMERELVRFTRFLVA